jgi:hypothetical protein
MNKVEADCIDKLRKYDYKCAKLLFMIMKAGIIRKVFRMYKRMANTN